MRYRVLPLVLLLGTCGPEHRGNSDVQESRPQWEYATWQDDPDPYMGKQVWRTPDSVIEAYNEARLIEILCPDIEEAVRTNQGLYEKVLEVALLQCFGSMGWELVSRAEERDDTTAESYTLYTLKRQKP